MPRLRLMLLGLGLFALAWSESSSLQTASAQVTKVPGVNRNGGATSLGLNLADRELVKQLKSARQLTESGDDAGAVSKLQFILNLPQDGFYRPEDELSGRFMSLKQQAESMLTKASPEALRIYEVQFGPEARRLFARVVAERNPKLAEEVMRRFIHTAAGAEAVYWLGSYHMDRADYESALQCLLRLRRLPAGAQFEPLLSLRAGMCLYRTGRTERAQKLIGETASTLKSPIKIGGQTLSPNGTEQQILAWLKTAAPPPGSATVTEPTGWLLARGNSERNRLLRSSPPVGKSLWNVSVTDWTVPSEQDPDKESVLDVGPQLQALTSVHADRGISALPCSSPLLVNDVVVARFFDHLAGFDVRTGQELWRSAENDRIFQLLLKNLASKDPVTNTFNTRMRSPRELFSILLRQRTWEDLTFGTLSSDGDFVFSVEDLGFLNDIMQLNRGGMPGLPDHPLMMRGYNRLCAYEAKTGKAKWELGGRGGHRGDISLPQADTFFLGPPLPIDHQLMCLVESQGLIQLLVLESRTGKTLWTQILSQPNDNVVREPQRRRAGLTPALMGDLLVCPTGSGLVVTVDLASRALAWAYQYTPPSPADGKDPRMVQMQLAMRGFPQVEMDPLRGATVDEWQDGSPIVAEGHVILTPRDSAELHCLSLEDGKVAWRRPRKDGLYIAAVQSGLVIVVSGRSVEALRLTDGQPAWTQPVATTNQAGRGIVTETHILLPLITNEVLSIDLKTGRSLARSRIHDKVLLGNMIPGPGLIVTQSAKKLAAYRTLDSVSIETAKRLSQNPQDAEALAQRGEYRLSQGELADGQADLRQSLKLRPSADTQTVLFESLLQGLQSDFVGHRPLLTELDGLAQTPLQRASLYRTWAEGLLTANELSPAFDVLLKLSDPALGKPEMERLGGHRSMRRDHWIRTQLQVLIPKVDEATRTRIQTELRQRLTAALADKKEDALRNYLWSFGSHPLADEARQALADRLIEKQEYNIEAEQLLAKLVRNSDPQIAGRALAIMIRELVKLEQGKECDLLVKRLAREFSDVVCLDKKTGKQLAEGWRDVTADAGAFAADWPTGRVDVASEAIAMRNAPWNYDVVIDGDPGPFFPHSQFKTTQDGQRLVGLNGWGETKWAIPLSELGPIANISIYRAQVRNHVVFVTMGAQVCAVSTLMSGKGIRAATMWNSPLVEGSLGEQNFFQVMVNRPGMFRPQLNRFDFRQNPVGVIGVLEDDTVVVLRGRHLILMDLVTGEPLWKRSDIAPGSEIFGDGESIVVVPPNQTDAEHIRRLDGVTVGMVPVPPQPARILTHNSKLLSFTRLLAKNSIAFELTDIPAKKQVWERSFDLQSQFTVISNSELAVLEPSGQLSLVQLSDGQIRWQQKLTLAVSPKDLWVIPNGDRLLVVNGEIPARNLNRPAMVLNNTQIMIDGQAEWLDRETGKIYWTQRIDGLGLDFSLPQYLPFWLFSVRTANIQGQNLGKQEFQLLALDKRSGQVPLKLTESSMISNYQVTCEPHEKQVRLTLFGSPQSFQHIVKYTDQPVEGPAKPNP